MIVGIHAVQGCDQGWMNARRVREELALRMQNGGLTTHYMQLNTGIGTTRAAPVSRGRGFKPR